MGDIAVACAEATQFQQGLVDGVPANDIGGGVDLSQFATTGVERVENFAKPTACSMEATRSPGSSSVSTRRGQTAVPELTASIDGGNLGTNRQDVSLGGVVKRFDYFADGYHFKTDNSVPNNTFRNNTFAGRIGWVAGSSTNISATVRRIGTEYGVPNGFSLFKIADDSSQTTDLTFPSVSADSQMSERWRGTIRVGWMNRDYHNVNPTPSGIPSGGNYLGQIVTLEGANGYSVTGQGILDFCCTSVGVRLGHHASNASGPDKFPGLPGARALGRRARRERGWLHAEHLQIGQRAHQWRRVCRSSGERQSRVCQRRVWRRSQRSLRHGRDASRLCRRVSSQPLVDGRIRRYEADVQRGHRDQGAHHFAGTVVPVQRPATAP